MLVSTYILTSITVNKSMLLQRGLYLKISFQKSVLRRTFIILRVLDLNKRNEQHVIYYDKGIMCFIV